MTLLYAHDLPGQFGPKRRELIKQWFDAHADGQVCVNNKWQIQLKHDPDLQKLVKDGFLKQQRRWVWGPALHGGWKKVGKRQTILVKC